jgi:hypothetical protein
VASEVEEGAEIHEDFGGVIAPHGYCSFLSIRYLVDWQYRRTGEPDKSIAKRRLAAHGYAWYLTTSPPVHPSLLRSHQCGGEAIVRSTIEVRHAPVLCLVTKGSRGSNSSTSWPISVATTTGHSSNTTAALIRRVRRWRRWHPGAARRPLQTVGWPFASVIEPRSAAQTHQTGDRSTTVVANCPDGSTSLAPPVIAHCTHVRCFWIAQD